MMKRIFFMSAAISSFLIASPGNVHAEECNTQTNEPSPLAKGAWTVVVLPDTQNYVLNDKNHQTLDEMMEWIVAEKKNRNIPLVVHVGDLTNNNNEPQWERVRSSYAKLDNVLPYHLCVGNHDQTSVGDDSLINNYFKIGDNPLNQKLFGGSFEPNKLQNTYYYIDQNGEKYLFLALEYNTRQPVIEWADKLIKEHPEHHVFIIVHQYMTETSRLVSEDGRPDPQSKRGDGNDDVGIWVQLGEPNPNVEFIVCGHVWAAKRVTEGPFIKGFEGVVGYEHDIATGHRSDAKDNGLTVHQMLFNAQWIRDDQGMKTGGDGWLLLLEFSPDNKDVMVKTFSPHLGLWRTGPEYEYSLKRQKNAKINSDSQPVLPPN